MFFCFIDRTLKACAKPTFISRLSAVLMILGAIIVGSSCGGGHSSAFTSTTAGNNAAAGLNISGTLPSAVVGTNYSGSLAVTGGTGPYTFAVASGQLPNGIALAKDSGSVSGTPSSAGTFNFVVSALDAKGNSSQKSLQIPVADNAATSSGSGSGASSNGGSKWRIEWREFEQRQCEQRKILLQHSTCRRMGAVRTRPAQLRRLFSIALR